MAIIGNQINSTNYLSDTFSGDGSTVAFNLSLAPASAASISVTVSGLYQIPGSAYTVSGSTLTFTGAPPTGTNNIYVLYLGVKNQNLVPVNGSITPQMLNNANVIYWSVSNNNVGIGNTTPAAPFVVGRGIATFTNPLAQFGGSANSWVQINAQNANNGNNASTDMVLARSDGTDTTGYIDIGVNSNTYSQAAYSLMTANSGYVFVNGGDLFLGTQTAHNVVIHTGNTTTGSGRVFIAANGNVGIGTSTPISPLNVSAAASPAVITHTGTGSQYQAPLSIRSTSTNYGCSLQFYDGTNDGYISWYQQSMTLAGTGGTPRLTVAANGSVMVGTAGVVTPSALQVNNSITIGGNDGAYTFSKLSHNSSTHDLEIISNAYPANLGAVSGVRVKAGSSGGGGPNDVAYFSSNGYVQMGTNPFAFAGPSGTGNAIMPWFKSVSVADNSTTLLCTIDGSSNYTFKFSGMFLVSFHDGSSPWGTKTWLYTLAGRVAQFSGTFSPASALVSSSGDLDNATGTLQPVISVTSSHTAGQMNGKMYINIQTGSGHAGYATVMLWGSGDYASVY